MPGDDDARARRSWLHRLSSSVRAGLKEAVASLAAKRHLKRGPLVDIRRLGAGELVKIVGRVVALEAPLRAPITGRACVYYRAEVGRLGLEHNVRPLFTLERGDDFLVEDDSGSVRIRMQHVEVRFESERHGESAMSDPRPEVMALLEQHHIEWHSKFFRTPIGWNEGVLEPGARVAVVGRVSVEPGVSGSASAGDYREAPSELVLVAPAPGRLLVTDDRTFRGE